MTYDRAKDDLSEINRLFQINSKNREIVLFGETTGQDGKVYKLMKDDANYPIRENFLEVCYNSKVPQSNVADYLTMLQKRIDDIEETIDHHFELIKKIVFADRQAKIWKNILKENTNGQQKPSQEVKTNRSQKSKISSQKNQDQQMTADNTNSGFTMGDIREIME